MDLESNRTAADYVARKIREKVEDPKLADLQVLDKNPLDDIRNTNTIKYVMKNGRLYDGDTVDEIWPRQRKTAAPYGLADTPKAVAGERP